MRWSMIRLIWFRELRDQLRDRRTVFMIAVLPIILYPVLGAAVIQLFAAGLAEDPVIIGIRGGEPFVAGAGGDEGAKRAYPPLIVGDRFPNDFFDDGKQAEGIRVRLVKDDGAALLEARQIDLLADLELDFRAKLERGEKALVEFTYRANDDRSRMAGQRFRYVLSEWKRQQREVRLERSGIPKEILETFDVRDPEFDKTAQKRASEGLFDLLLRIFPFLLVMWSLAGALYPAVDLCAGEKERGTMETLLISPASREEIVWGKFLTIWVFSAATALLNLLSMGITMWRFGGTLTQDATPGPDALLWCILLLLPLSAFFSALCLAMGAYARSSKEGQYYLMPLFLVTMPLVFLTLVPGVELSPLYSLVPVTGVALLLRRLMESSLDTVPWMYFLPVLAPIMLYSWMALRWAIEQFKREEVLFREAERLDIGLWFRRLLREKEPIPTVGQALFCFFCVVALRWFSFTWGSNVSHLTHIGVTLVAFVAAPTLLMAVVLTTRPLEGLALRPTAGRYLLVAFILALLLLWPLTELTLYILNQFPILQKLLSEHQPVVEALQQLQTTGSGLWWYALILAVLPALSSELLFRGFLLTGLLRRFKPTMAVFLSSLLFGLYHLNVFQFLPALVLGMVLGLLTIKSGSVLPAMLFLLLHNGVQVFLTGQAQPLALPEDASPELIRALRIGLTVATSLLAAGILVWLLRQRAEPRETVDVYRGV